MAVDFNSALGVDFSGLDDIDANLTLVDGRLGYAQAIFRRLTTPRGRLFYDPEYGIDIREFVKQSGFSATQVSRLIEGECLKDERTLNAAAEVTFNEATEEMKIDLTLIDDEGPFTLTLNVTALTVELLDENT